MAQSRRETPNTTLQEVAGLTLLVVGALLLLALVSYSPGDVPSWLRSARVDKNAGNSPQLCRFARGHHGVLELHTARSREFPARRRAHRLRGTRLHRTADGICDAAAVDRGICCQRSVSDPCAWLVSHRSRKAESSAAKAGSSASIIGGKIFTPSSARRPMLVLLLIYVVCIILMTGLRPIAVVRRLIACPARNGCEARRKRHLERASEEQRMTLEQKKLDRERNGASSGKSCAGPTKTLRLPRMEQAELLPLDEKKEAATEPEPERPAPKIFDAAARSRLRQRRKRRRKRSSSSRPSPARITSCPPFDLLDAVDIQPAGDEPRGTCSRCKTTSSRRSRNSASPSPPGDITKGPTITRYEVYPARGVRVDRIATYERDLARATLRRAHQHPRADSRQGHRRHRDRQFPQADGHAARTARERRIS